MTLPGLEHHTFFFDDHLEGHLRAVFDRGGDGGDAPTRPVPEGGRFAFYVGAPARTDPGGVAPPGGDALFVLVPVPFRLPVDKGGETNATRAVFEHIVDRLDAHVHEYQQQEHETPTGEATSSSSSSFSLRDHLVYVRYPGHRRCA